MTTLAQAAQHPNYKAANDREAYQEAYAEIQTATDLMRYAYLKWIGYQMWKLFDYKSGLEAINSKEAYLSFKHGINRGFIEDAKHDIQHRDETREPITSQLKLCG